MKNILNGGFGVALNETVPQFAQDTVNQITASAHTQTVEVENPVSIAIGAIWLLKAIIEYLTQRKRAKNDQNNVR